VRQRIERDAQALELRDRPTLVLPCITDPARREHREERCPRRGGAARVHDLGVGHEPNRVSGIPDAPADVGVLAVEEEAFIHPAERLEQVAPEEDARA
jgi:hypothetical protein